MNPISVTFKETLNLPWGRVCAATAAFLCNQLKKVANCIQSSIKVRSLDFCFYYYYYTGPKKVKKAQIDILYVVHRVKVHQNKQRL